MATSIRTLTSARSVQSRRLDSVRPSSILSIAAECRRRGGVDLATGIPDDASNRVAVEGAAEALHTGRNVYADARGVAPLRRAIAEKLRCENGLDYDADGELLVTSGVTGGFAATVMALFEPGDEILVPEPFFGWHLNLLRLAGLDPRPVPTTQGSLDPAALERALTERTRGLVLCTPANPTGRSYTTEELSAVARIARDEDLVVVTDEQYEQFCYDGTTHVSPASIEDLRTRTVTLMGFSKSLSITGWRLGYAAAPRELIEPIQTLHQLFYICPPTPLQHGVADALNHRDSDRRARISGLERKRNELAAALSSAGFSMTVPSAGFFILAELADPSPVRGELAHSFLAQTGVAAVSGREFFAGSRGERSLRFCFAKSDKAIAEACRRLRHLSTHSSLDRRLSC